MSIVNNNLPTSAQYKIMAFSISLHIFANMKEKWKSIIGYEGLYEVSTFGNIKSLVKKGNNIQKIRKQGLDISTGYATVQLNKNGTPLTKRVHRLVAEAFLDKPSPKHIVNHKDGNKKNNRLDNLEWVTYSENTFHSFRTGLQKKIFGNENYITKIKNEDVVKIRELIKLGFTNKDIASKFNVNPSQISRIKTGERRSHIL